MFQRWFGRRKNSGEMQARAVQYYCEHDGAPERQLKSELRQLFASRTGVAKAYLAVIGYQGGPHREVALCVTGVPDQDRAPLVEQIGTVFARLFNVQQHLDILFPSGEEEDRLAKVCRPFFIAMAKTARPEP